MERRKCPYCGEEIVITAKKCRFCGEWLGNYGGVASGRPSISQAPSSAAATPRTENKVITNPQPSVQNQNAASHSQVSSQNPISANREAGVGSIGCSMSFFKAYFETQYLRRYTDFTGYTTRKSFWLSCVSLLIVGIGLNGVMLLLSSLGMGGIIVGGVIVGIIGFTMIVPGLALCCRRLRDAGKNPWLILLGLIPVVGTVILLIFLCQESKFEDAEEEGHWQMSDWIVTGICAVLMIFGIALGIISMKGVSVYDLGLTDDEMIEINDISSEYGEITNSESVNSEPGYYSTSEIYKFGGTIPVSGDISAFKSLSEEYLQDGDIRYYSSSELRILRNAIYAMHGYSFDSQDLQDYFMEFDHYHPYTKTPNLNEVEQYNVNLIKKYE